MKKAYRKLAASLLLITAALPVVASAHPPIAAERAIGGEEYRQPHDEGCG